MLTRDQEALKKLRDCQESLASSEKENAALKKQVEDLTMMIANLEDDIKLGMEQLNAKKAEIDALNEKVTEVEDELKKLREQVASLTEERDKLAKEGAVSADLEAELKKLREQLASLTEERDKLTEEAAMLAVTRTELESKTVETEAAKAALKDARDEVERLKKLLADKEAALKQAD
jgi:chromosome segregation ATPase